jgi:hypothetical protein
VADLCHLLLAVLVPEHIPVPIELGWVPDVQKPEGVLQVRGVWGGGVRAGSLAGTACLAMWHNLI